MNMRALVARRGESLVEIAAALLVLSIAILGMISVLLSSSSLSATNRETMVAMAGAQARIELLRGSTFDTLVAIYGTGGSVGPDFDVEGLSPAADDADGREGRIRFFTDERENTPESVKFGIPGRDLDGDGMASSANTAQDANPADGEVDYVVLPVRIEVRWSGHSGTRSISIHTLIGE